MIIVYANMDTTIAIWLSARAQGYDLYDRFNVIFDGKGKQMEKTLETNALSFDSYVQDISDVFCV